MARAAFNRAAAEDRQFIPLDPFGDERSIVGGVIATASSGPLRCAYGTPRDWLIGVAVVHADGRTLARAARWSRMWPATTSANFMSGASARWP